VGRGVTRRGAKRVRRLPAHGKGARYGTSTGSCRERITEEAWQANFGVAAGTSPFATYACVDTWLTAFRDDLPKIDVPVLVVHGTEARILPFEATSARLPALIDDVRLVAVEGGPHNIAWTHPDEVNRALLEFVREPVPTAV
jgi:non-heme chloroperoxidase